MATGELPHACLRSEGRALAHHPAGGGGGAAGGTASAAAAAAAATAAGVEAAALATGDSDVLDRHAPRRAAYQYRPA